jgi:hypothetical protein
MSDRNDRLEWDDEDAYWRTNYRNRPYVSAGADEYDLYRPGYKYGYEAANKYEGRNWDEVESDLSSSWHTYEDRGNSTWEQIKGAVRDAWDRVTGKRTVGAR